MRDFDIRQHLKGGVLSKFYNDGESRVVEELSIPAAKARIDMAVINGHFHGFEIKGASDTLQRLPNQLEAYSKVFDFLYVVTEPKYYESILKIIPSWVGILICSETQGIPEVTQKKQSERNPNQDGFHIAKLLWNEELIEILTEQEIKFKKKERHWILCEILAQNLDVNKISELVRKKIKVRSNWKSDT